MKKLIVMIALAAFLLIPGIAQAAKDPYSFDNYWQHEPLAPAKCTVSKNGGGFLICLETRRHPSDAQLLFWQQYQEWLRCYKYHDTRFCYDFGM